MKIWSLYLVRTRHQALYTGITTDTHRRFEEHCGSDGKGAKYLRSRGPLKLVYQTKIGSRSLALKAERLIKKLPKEKKERIVSENPEGEALLGALGLRGAPFNHPSDCG